MATVLLPDKVTAVLITREAEYPRDISFDVTFDEVLVETNCQNLTRRFDLIAQARNEVVYVQDDDCQVPVSQLFRAYNGRLTNCISWGHLQIYNGLCGNRCTLIGWGSLFPKSLVNFAPWEDVHGPIRGSKFDIEIDRIFTYLAYKAQGAPHNSVILPFDQIPRPRAMSRDNTDHYHSRDRVIKLLEAL